MEEITEKSDMRSPSGSVCPLERVQRLVRIRASVNTCMLADVRGDDVDGLAAEE